MLLVMNVRWQYIMKRLCYSAERNEYEEIFVSNYITDKVKLGLQMNLFSYQSNLKLTRRPQRGTMLFIM